MLCIQLKGTDLCADFSFFAVLALLFLTGADGRVGTALLCCALHEAGHLLAMAHLRLRPKGIVLYGGGIKIVPARTALPAQEAAILAAGPLANLAAAAVCHIAGLSFPAAVNLALAAFNLLPFRHFDGGRLLRITAGDKAADAVSLLLTVSALTSALLLIPEASPPLSLTAALVFVAAAGMDETVKWVIKNTSDRSKGY